MKLDKYAILSAFMFYFIMPFIIISRADKKSILPIASMAIILGSLIGEYYVSRNLYL